MMCMHVSKCSRVCMCHQSAHVCLCTSFTCMYVSKCSRVCMRQSVHVCICVKVLTCVYGKSFYVYVCAKALTCRVCMYVCMSSHNLRTYQI